MSLVSTQEQLEQQMCSVGLNRAHAEMAMAERTGHAERNPYMATIYRDFVTPLASLIQKAQASTKAGRHKKHAALLKGLDPWAVAYIVVRTVMVKVLAGDRAATVRALARSLGRRVYEELYLQEFKSLKPDLYYIVSEDLDRRKAQDEEYLIRQYKQQAEAIGLDLDKWSLGAQDALGAWFIEQLVVMNLLVLDNFNLGPGRRAPINVHLTPEIEDVVEQVKETVALLQPFYGPCIEPPKDWTSWSSGGWHTAGMRRSLPHPVKARSAARALLKKVEMPTVWNALNALQRVPWRINDRVLHVVDVVSRTKVTGELIRRDPEDKPDVPEWLATVDEADRSPEQEAEFKAWKSAMTAWYTKRNVMRTHRLRFGTTLRIAQQYVKYPTIYFVYFCDSRGRVYPMTQGVSPQGSDLQRGLLEFAEGKPLATESARRWFKVHGANKYGEDKLSFAKRVQWVDDNAQMLYDIGNDPINNTDWQKADDPIQFLAWCIEYAAWQDQGAQFKSHIPVSMDGSNSGLQHFSAMLRDEVGGEATNLTPSPVPQDLYARVALSTTRQLEAELRKLDPGSNEYRWAKQWLEHGVNRSVVKRPTMTTPYGVTKRSATKYIIHDYMVNHSEFDPQEHYKMAAFLVKFVWKAIGENVKAAREAMDWLARAGREIIKEERDSEGCIYWYTPSGFVATQCYYKLDSHLVGTELYGHARIKVVTESNEPNARRHGQALAPNFVHSMDASHLHLTVQALAEERAHISLAMIHDDFGTHAADAEELATALREQFVLMYSNNDVLEQFALTQGITEPTPEKGSLDIRQVLDSPYIFA